jgi:hypothetical protein
VTEPLRPLAQLLLDSVRDAGGPTSAREFDDRLTAMSVEEVAAAGSLHRITPAVARHVEQMDGVPEEWRDKLGRFRKAQLLRHLRTRADLGLVQSALDSAGIAWVAVKGPISSDLNWPRPDLREYYDLDVVIDRHRLSDVLRVLEAAGCAYVDRNWPLLRKTMRAEIAMRAPEGTPLDLHWDIAVPMRLRRAFRIDVAAMLARRCTATLGDGHQSSVLDPVDAVFHLAFHAAHSGVSRLMWPADVWFAGRQLSREGWARLRAQALAFRAELPVALVLARMVDLFGKPARFDDQLLKPANGCWGQLVRHRDRIVPQPGLPGDPHLGGTLYSSARRSLAASLLDATISRWRLHWLERPSHPRETESDVLGRNVPDAAARLSYVKLVESGAKP